MGLDRDVIFKQVQNSCLRLARNNAQTQGDMLENFKIDYLQGEATLDLGRFNGRPSMETAKLVVRPTERPSETIDVSSSKVLLCTGSFASHPPGIPFDSTIVHDSDSVNGLTYLPKSVVVAGSGIIAIEMANIFRKLGASVTMVVRGSALSALERIGLDETIAERLLLGLDQQGVRVLENTVVDDFTLCTKGMCDGGMPIGGENADTVQLCLKSKDAAGELQPAGSLEVELYLACLGRSPRARGTSLELEANGVKLVERSGHIQVNERFETTQSGIYAAGDCIVGPALASTGVDQAQRAVESMFGCSGKMCKTEETPFPIGVWTIPEVGYYGLTLKEAREQGYDAEEGIATYDMCLRGRVFSPDGMLKLVFDRKSAVILGVHIIGTDACELVHYGMDLVAKRATLFEVIDTLFTAVTFHELFKEAAFAGNHKLEFGIEWQELLGELQVAMTGTETAINEEELRKKFDQIDTSGDGSLDSDELSEVFSSMGSEVSPSLVANLVRLADDDGNGTIEWPEFLKIFQVIEQMNASENGSKKGSASAPSTEVSAAELAPAA
jgi:pyruvate/2-oxoglutarate dehydrogenase complex dihydrolipoamide dehydrogenase (E3) component